MQNAGSRHRRHTAPVPWGGRGLGGRACGWPVNGPEDPARAAAGGEATEHAARPGGLRLGELQEAVT